MLAGLALGLHDLGAKSLWLDEATSFDRVTRGVGALWGYVSGGDPNMSLYYVSLDAWLRVFGSSEAALRGLSVLCGVLSIPVVVALGRRLFGEREGLVAGVLFVLSAFIVQYEQTARSYAMLVLLVLLSMYFFVLELEQPSRLSAAGLVVASVLAVYAHYFAVLVLLVEAGAALAIRGRSAWNRRWLLLACAVAIGLIPAYLAADPGSTSGGGIPGLSGLSWIPHSSLAALPALVWDLNGRNAILAGVLVGFALYAIWVGARSGRRWPSLLVGAWFVAPIALAFLVSLAKPIFVEYYLIFTLPALLILAAAGIVRVPLRAASVIGLAAAVGLSAYSLTSWYGAPSREDFRAAALYMTRQRHVGDAYVTWPNYAAAPLDYYLVRDHTIADILPAPAPVGPPAHRPPRIWLIVREGDARGAPAQFAAAARTIETGYAVRSTERFSGVKAILLVSCGRRATRCGP